MDFNMLNILRTCQCINEALNATVITQNIPGWASVSFQSFKFDAFVEKLEEMKLPVIPKNIGIIGYSEDMPEETSCIDQAANFILKADWYLVKMERTGEGEIYNRVSRPYLWKYS
jgi:hypothetical protein